MSNMTINEVYRQLEQVVSASYARLASTILFKIDDHIVVFNEYVMKNNADGSVTVMSRRKHKTAIFSNSKNAFVWIVLDHYNKCYESDRVIALDAKIAGLTVEIGIHRKLKSKGNLDQYVINVGKIQNEIERRDQSVAELERYTRLAMKLSENRMSEQKF